MSAQMIDKDELTGAAVLLDSALCLMQDLTEDYFVKYDHQSEDGRFGIVFDYNCYRFTPNPFSYALSPISTEQSA